MFVTSLLTTKVEDPPPITEAWTDDFERSKVGGNYYRTGGNYHLKDGELRIQGAYNHPMWLRKKLPRDVSIELDTWSSSKDGDIKVEFFGDGRSHMFELRVDVDAAKWRVGDTVRLAVPSAEPTEVLAVPRDALVLRREGASVFRVTHEGLAEQVTVIPGVGSGAMIGVSGPLEPGDRVIARGAERLRPGQPVQVVGDGPGSAGGAPAS